MAGHSKWANIKHKKAAVDAKRGKIWTKLIREITVAAKVGGGEINDNPRLRLAVDKATGANMPKDTIERAIKRGAGGGESDNVEELTYEGYGPSGVAILVEAMTDNRNRTVAEVRHAFSKHGGNLGTDGSVAYLFEKKGVIAFAPGADEDAIIEACLEAGADDVEAQEDGSVQVTTTPEAFQQVKEALEAAGLEPDDAEVTMIPDTYSELDAETSETVMKLVERLEDLEDVQNVYSNASYDDSVYG
ncbi:MAG: YebC/PmpR family DNA-binding transcriptional regulator [Pseudomonadales bacterium]|jgi:YebC/PmpR family DNA-binding regulatory protein|nr:YebC/PmpR family DNA-binding transcriptional regulator [Pseudomonadales bacterium]